MPKQMVEIDVPDGYECVGWRLPRKNESYLSGGVSVAVRDFEVVQYPVVRPIWQPPAFLKPGWIAMDMNGTWYWYEAMATRGVESWNGMYPCRLACLNWTPPPCTDWRESRREIKAVQQ